MSEKQILMEKMEAEMMETMCLNCGSQSLLKKRCHCKNPVKNIIGKYVINCEHCKGQLCGICLEVNDPRNKYNKRIQLEYREMKEQMEINKIKRLTMTTDEVIKMIDDMWDDP